MDPFKEHMKEQLKTSTGEPDNRWLRLALSEWCGKAPHHLSAERERWRISKDEEKELKKRIMWYWEGKKHWKWEEKAGDLHRSDAVGMAVGAVVQRRPKEQTPGAYA